jgi:hypothetical protein
LSDVARLRQERIWAALNSRRRVSKQRLRSYSVVVARGHKRAL